MLRISNLFASARSASPAPSVYTPEDIETALNAAKNAKPHRYKLLGQNNSTPRFFVLGCQGSGKESQQQVAELMFQIAQDPNKKPDFILFLGDNYYDDGVSAVDDSVIKSRFDDMYAKFASLGIPCFIIFGNHDVNYHEASYLKTITQINSGKSKEYLQIANSLLPDVTAKAALYASDYLHLKELPVKNLPNNIYSLAAGDTEIICLDSNFLVKEFLAFQQDVNGTSADNQAKWLQNIYQQAKQENKKVVIALHHPPYHTAGKRANPANYDSHHYLTAYELNAVKKLLNCESDSYNELIALLLDKLNVKPDKTYAAHDHFISIYDDGNTVQFTSGGGGGDRQTRLNFLGHPHVKCHQKKFGFMIDDGNKTEIYTTDNYHLVYDHIAKHFIQDEIFDEHALTLKELVLEACDEYLEKLKQIHFTPVSVPQDKTEETIANDYGRYFNVPYANTLYSIYNTIAHPVKIYSKKISHIISDYINKDVHLNDEINCVQNIQAFLKQEKLPDIKDIINEIYQLIQCVTAYKNDAKYPFYSILESKLHNQWGSTLDFDTLYRAANEVLSSNMQPGTMASLKPL